LTRWRVVFAIALAETTGSAFTVGVADLDPDVL